MNQTARESVWDYPRPPRLEPNRRHLEVIAGGRVIAETRGGFRVLETSHPPVYYFPPGDILPGVLRRVPGKTSFCEWKGKAVYDDVVVNGRVIPAAAWSYPDPRPAFSALQDHMAFYPGPMDACRVDGETVTAQPGGFYGGWITKDIVGPFKGEDGSWSW